MFSQEDKTGIHVKLSTSVQRFGYEILAVYVTDDPSKYRNGGHDFQVVRYADDFFHSVGFFNVPVEEFVDVFLDVFLLESANFDYFDFDHLSIGSFPISSS